MSVHKALGISELAGLDLVEIAPLSNPPVCRIMDFGKFKYQESKRAQEARAKQKQVQVKEMQFRPMTDEADYQTKLRNLSRFLQEGDKTKITLRFKGREIAHQEFGLRLMNRLKDDLSRFGTVESQPRLEGKQMVMLVGPHKNTQ